MRFITHSLFGVLLALLLASCNVHVSGGGQKYVGAGVTFLVPMQTSNVINGTEGIKYESKTLTAETDGKTLTVNGKSYGAVHAGDTVDLTTLGVVKVNGVVREADAEAAKQGHEPAEQNLESVEKIRKAAEQGDAASQITLGKMYESGQGVTQDKAEAAKWYGKAAETLRKAAEQGDAVSQFNLGKMYEEGQGVTRDNAEAAKWYRKAAEQGNAMAQTNLGLLYDKGQGVKQNYAKAVMWYRKAAEQGNAISQERLGSLYYSGAGIKRNDVEAVKWYRLAAEQGYPVAQCNLANMYSAGRGVAKDDAEAVKWYRKAADQGYQPALQMFRMMEMARDGLNDEKK